MIFLTVGHQMPFDRLIRVVDAWAEREGRADLFAQIGDGRYWPRSFQAVPFMTPRQFQVRLSMSQAVIGHAGTGSIIAALQAGKPMLVMPRRADLQETRNDHQFATARFFGDAGLVLVAESETDVAAKINALTSFQPKRRFGEFASEQLTARIRDFLRSAS
jgi:UDP-N-acetylglucosamine transferase subunit ALG13